MATSYERPLATHADTKERLESIFGGGTDLVEAEKKVVCIQRWVRSRQSRTSIQKLAKLYRESDLTKRSRLRQLKTQEIIDTEHSYVNSLEQLLIRYYHPMKALTTAKTGLFSKTILSSQEHAMIFMNITLIEEFHKSFYTELCTEYSKWPSAPVRLGRVFIKYSPFMKLYTEYTNCYQQAIDTLMKCSQRSPFSEWLTPHRQANMDVVSFESLLIMPIQRIPRYRMLLEEVVKYSPENHVDYADLCTALETVKEIAKYINEKKRSSENMEKVVSIQATIFGLPMNIAHPLRRLLKRGVLVRRNIATNTEETRYFYLFNDMMLCTSESGEETKLYDGYILIRGAKVTPAKQKNEFGITYKSGKTFYYRTTTAEKKEKWVSYFHKGISEMQDQALEQSPDFLMEPEHFGGGTSSKAGAIKTLEAGLVRTAKTKERWFVLRNGVLCKHKTKSSKDIICSIQLENYLLRKNSLIKPDLMALDLVNPVSCHTLIFPSLNEKKGWTKAFEDEMNTFGLPITDICVIQADKGDKVPLGFTPIQETYYGHTGNVNADDAGRKIFICYERGGVDQKHQAKPPITDLAIIFTDTGSMMHRRVAEAIPEGEGWVKIEKTHYQRDEANLNSGRGGREIFLLYRRQRGKPGITQLSMYWQSQEECVPPKFVGLEHTVTGRFRADLNSGGGGPQIFLCYKKESNEDQFLQNQLGWEPCSGFTKLKMSLAWQQILAELGFTDDQIAKDAATIRFAVEEILQKYQELEEEKELLNSVICYCCKRQFDYPNNTNKVLCPFCQTVNQCTFMADAKKLSQSHSANTLPVYASHLAPVTPVAPSYQPSYISQVPSSSTPVPAYLSSIPQAYAQPAYVPAYAVPPPSAYQQQVQPPAYQNPMMGNMEDIPLGIVSMRPSNSMLNVTQDPLDNIDFASMNPDSYAELIQYTRSRLELRADGLHDFEIIE